MVGFSRAMLRGYGRGVLSPNNFIRHGVFFGIKIPGYKNLFNQLNSEDVRVNSSSVLQSPEEDKHIYLSYLCCWITVNDVPKYFYMRFRSNLRFILMSWVEVFYLSFLIQSCFQAMFPSLINFGNLATCEAKLNFLVGNVLKIFLPKKLSPRGR